MNININYEQYKMLYYIKLTFLKELMLIRLANEKSSIFATIDIYQAKILNFKQMSAMGVMIY